MLDRIGRKPEEMKYIFETLKKENIKIWSVSEGEICDYTDQEADYYRQCSIEVEKTSYRVKKRFEQLNEEGIFTGGSPPFGYQLVKNNS
jgi:DNA invertase Pin-like site-specific DNA recombinase